MTSSPLILTLTRPQLAQTLFSHFLQCDRCSGQKYFPHPSQTEICSLHFNCLQSEQVKIFSVAQVLQTLLSQVEQFWYSSSSQKRLLHIEQFQWWSSQID